jgi:phosphonopyruvate decarboxylase
MIEAADFVEQARGFGYQFYTGVPCSFLTPFINYTIADETLNYLSCANEGDALAVGAGTALGGQRAVVMMQNSGLGNAVNPLTSLAHVFRIPVLLIITLRGDPQLTDEPQHQLMGRITPKLLENMTIPWEYFPTQPTQIREVLSRIEAYMALEQRPYALIMRKGSVAPFEPPSNQTAMKPKQTRIANKSSEQGTPLQKRMARVDVLRRIIELTPEHNSVVIATTGYTGRELAALADRPNQLYMVGSMGCAPALSLGLSLTRPDLTVLVVDGDGAALMRLGNFATLGAYGGTNLVHILLDNEVHESTGAQPTVSAGMSFAQIAGGCGYPVTIQGDSIDVIDAVLNASEDIEGPRFAHLKIRRGVTAPLPRPTLSPEQVRQRLMNHIGATFMFAQR